MGNGDANPAAEPEKFNARPAFHEGDIARGGLLLERVRRLHIAGQDIKAVSMESEIGILGNHRLIDQIELGDIADAGILAGHAQARCADFTGIE